MSGKLTPKQAIFAGEYLIDFNATRAAIAAGFAEGSAAVTGARLLRNEKVAAAIAARQQRIAEKLEISVERTARKLAEIGYGDVREMLDEEGNLLPVHRMSEGASALVAGLEVQTTEGPAENVKVVVHKVKISDRLRALELLGRYQKMFTDRLEHEGRITLEDLVCGGSGDGVKPAA